MKKKRGFSLIELLVVIGIIALLMAIIIPMLAGARAGAQQAQCAANLRQLHQGVTTLATGNMNRLVSAYHDEDAGVWRQVSFDASDAADLATAGILEGVAETPPDSVTCPGADYTITWPVDVDMEELEIGYQYMGGIETWVNDQGSYPARSPVRMDQARGDWVLAADRSTVGAAPDEYARSGATPNDWAAINHAGSDGAPGGQNQVYVDGSVEWVTRDDDLAEVHSGGLPAHYGASGPHRFFMKQKDLGTLEDDLGPNDMMSAYGG